MNVPLPDKPAKRLFLSPPHMGGAERTFVDEAFTSNYIAPLGPQVDAFEQEFAQVCGLPHCLALSSGTAAMHLALRLLGIQPGDLVLASTLTFIGSVTPVTFLDGRLLFVDSDRKTWNMDPDLLAQAIEDCLKKGLRPKAVIPTDLYGQCADYDRLSAICEPQGIALVIDAAESVGAFYRGRFAGDAGQAAIYSFNGNKIITTGGGGLLASRDKGLIEQARNLSQQARDPAPHYEHTRIGYNYRMSNILAGIGRGQLQVLADRVDRRREIFAYYKNALADCPGISFMPEAGYGRSNRWLSVLLINPAAFGADRETVRLALEAYNIESRPLWKPMHLQPVFKDCAKVGGAVSEALFEQGLCLPSGTAMTAQELDQVVDIVRGCGG